MDRLGQLQPVIIRKDNDSYQLIDGFKRYYAAEQLGLGVLYAHILDTAEAEGKAMMLNYNRVTNSLDNYEEGLIAYSLKRDHLLNRKEISTLLGYSLSWVCRRLMLVERLDKEVQSQLHLGNITPSHAREIIKLPREKQKLIARTIIGHNVTSRQSAVLIEMYLKSVSKQEREYLLDCPVEAIEKSEKDNDPYDCRLSRHGNRLLKSMKLLLIQHNIFTGQLGSHQSAGLTGTELSILHSMIKRLSGKITATVLLINKKQKNYER